LAYELLEINVAGEIIDTGLSREVIQPPHEPFDDEGVLIVKQTEAIGGTKNHTNQAILTKV
jgi:hypothetical protein